MAANVQALLRFLTDRKIPLTAAFAAVKSLNESQLSSVDAIAASNLETLQKTFPDEKTAKQVLAAAKRTTKTAKKRSSDDADGEAVAASPPTPSKRRRKASPIDPSRPKSWEKGLGLPQPNHDLSSLSSRIITTNRAPLLLAFAVVSLGYTSPHTPLSSRFSLGQGLLDLTAGVKAKSLGIAQPAEATIEEGYKRLAVLGRQIPVLRRYDVSPLEVKTEDEQPIFWALSAQLLEKPPEITSQNPSALPICLPHAAHGYLTRAFKSDELQDLLGALEVLYDSWKHTLSAAELDRRGWNWYCKVRPDVADGKQGWGGRCEVKLSELLTLRRIQKVVKSEPDA